VRTNAPRLITVVIALAFTVLGLSSTILPIPVINDAVAGAGFSLTREQGWIALAGSPILLIIGSIFARV
jgi:hypothetical protein